MTNKSMFLPLEKMKSSNLTFAICHGKLFFSKDVPLKDGLNSLENVGAAKFDIKSAGHILLTVDMEQFKQRTCPVEQVDSIALIMGCAVGGVLSIVGLGVVGFCVYRKNKQKEDEPENVDMNPDYGADNYEDKESEVKDSNDYYFYAKPDDNIEITDRNEYYD
jgi:hypothetical protein